MNAAQSLSQSADIAATQGRTELAEQYRTWAQNAHSLGDIGNALYRHFANEAAGYVARQGVKA